MRYQIIDTFTGPFAIIEDDGGELQTTWLTAEQHARVRRGKPDPTLQPELAQALRDYFDGKPVDFNDVPLPAASTFVRKCWQACRKIPRGTTISYGELARRAGSPGAARAAGQAMRRNPLPIITPCHRVVGSTGRLHGFGGTCSEDSSQLDVKSKLLQMEGAMKPARRRTATSQRRLAFA